MLSYKTIKSFYKDLGFDVSKVLVNNELYYILIDCLEPDVQGIYCYMEIEENYNNCIDEMIALN